MPTKDVTPQGSRRRRLRIDRYPLCVVAVLLTSPCISDSSPKKPAESALKSFLAGGVGGACVVLVGHPLDLIKVRMQTAGVGGGSTNVFGMLSQTFAKEGVRGIYRGASAPLVSISFIFAVCFCKFLFLETTSDSVTCRSLPAGLGFGS